MDDTATQVDTGYTDPWLARLYDAECPWHSQDDFYLALDRQAGSVLDVGCGTGTRLSRAAETGHPGPLVGVDPAQTMLDLARAKTDSVRWLLGDAQTLDVDGRFDLITMTGHAFQVLLDDEAVGDSLSNFRHHLAPDGLLAFETRNPRARVWEGWTVEQTRQRIHAPDGEPFEVWVDMAAEEAPDLVTFTASTRSVSSGEQRTSTSTLRFVNPGHLRDLLEQNGFRVEGWFGDWDRSPVTQTSPEVIVLARSTGDAAQSPIVMRSSSRNPS